MDRLQEARRSLPNPLSCDDGQIRGQRSEVRGQKSEVRDQRPETRDQRPEISQLEDSLNSFKNDLRQAAEILAKKEPHPAKRGLDFLQQAQKTMKLGSPERKTAHKQAKHLKRILKDDTLDERIKRAKQTRGEATTSNSKTMAPGSFPIILVDEQGNLIPEPKRIEAIMDHFGKVGLPDSLRDEDPIVVRTALRASLQHLSQTAMLFQPPFDSKITLDEIVEAQPRLHGGKSCKDDDVPADFLKWLSPTSLVPLQELFNNILQQGVVPSSWVYGQIVAILKPGKQGDHLGHYRPITLIETTAKLFEYVLYHRISGHLFPSIHQEQGGFQPRLGSMDQFFVFSETLQKARALKKQHVFAAFLDIKKAFDSVPHDALFSALARQGIHGRAWELLVQWYLNLKASVRVDGQQTPIFPMVTGTRQGSILSPLLFIVWINDLIGELKDAKLGTKPCGLNLEGDIIPCFLLADDIVLLSDTEEEMHHLLQITSNFIQRNGMSFNDGKCDWLVFNFSEAGDPHTRYPFSLNGRPLDYKTQYKYLGFTVSSAQHDFLHLVPTKRYLAAKAMTDMLQGVLDDSTRQQRKLEIYVRHVRPILEAGLAACPLTRQQIQQMASYEGKLLRDLDCTKTPQESLICRLPRLRKSFIEKTIRTAPKGSRRSIYARTLQNENPDLKRKPVRI
eukprot:Lithocolla_globosa_v1_NODE_186_length_5337_cov_5.779712.p1 type:complete len:676 gc:universal NODE_186_length_5337_cov_5.779712:3287-5314(+)